MKIKQMAKIIFLAPVIVPVLTVLSCGQNNEEILKNGLKPTLKEGVSTFKRYDLKVDSEGNIEVAIGKDVEIDYQEISYMFQRKSGEIIIEGLENYNKNIPKTYNLKIKDLGIGKDAKQEEINFTITVDDNLPGIAIDGVYPNFKKNNSKLKNKLITKKSGEFFVSLPASGDWPSVQEIKNLFKKPDSHELEIYIPQDYDEYSKQPGNFRFKINDPGNGQKPNAKHINFNLEMK